MQAYITQTIFTRKSRTYSGDLDELRQDLMQLVLRRRLPIQDIIKTVSKQVSGFNTEN